MGYDLSGLGGSFRVNTIGWEALLNLALFYGWQPQGTERPDETFNDKPWDKTYLSNEGQIVNSKDANNLADALEKALPDVPDHPITTEDAATLKLKIKGKDIAKEAELFLSSEEYRGRVGTLSGIFSIFGGPKKAFIKAFISFCRRGEFRIE